MSHINNYIEKYFSESLEVLNKLYDCYYKTNQFDRALETLVVLYKKRRAKSLNNIETVQILSKIGDMYYVTGKYPEAVQVRELVYSIYKKSLGEDDNRTLIALEDLAACSFRLGKYEDALKTMQSVYERRLQRYPDSDDNIMDIIGIVQDIALTYAAMGDLENALIKQNEYFELYQKYNGEEY